MANAVGPCEHDTGSSGLSGCLTYTPLKSPDWSRGGTVSVIYSAKASSKRFGPVKALQGVDFDVVEGKVNGLIGTNGSGKTTLLRIIAGSLAPDGGELMFDGRPLAMRSISDAARAGIAFVLQQLNLFPALSVEENLLLAPGGGSSRARRAFRCHARTVLEKLGVNVSLGARFIAWAWPTGSCSRLPERCCKIRVFSSSMNRRRHCMSPKSNVSTTSFAASASQASASSIAVTFSRNCWRCPTILPFCATASTSPGIFRRQAIS
jgi:ABC-type Fe3+/spermidine/putrescine transport system ATPase subunit